MGQIRAIAFAEIYAFAAAMSKPLGWRPGTIHRAGPVQSKKPAIKGMIAGFRVWHVVPERLVDH